MSRARKDPDPAVPVPQGLDLGRALPLDDALPIGFGADQGQGPARPVLLGPEDHALIIAPTGAGKGTSAIMPLLLEHTGPALVFDPKGEAAHVTADWRRKQGQKVFVIDPMAVTGLPRARLNPLDLVDLRRADAYDEARALADCLLLERGDPRNAFWINQARQVLTAAILQTVADASGPGRARIGDLVDLCSRLRPGAAVWLSRSRVPEVVQLASLLDLGAPETIGGVLHYVEEAMELLRSAPVQDCLGASSVPLSHLIEGRPVTIYFVLPPHMLRSHARLVRLWFGAIIQALARRARAPARPTLVLIDEAAQLGPLEPFVTLMTLMRGYGVQCVSCWQDPAQLIATYPGLWPSLRNNARLITAFGQTGPAALRDLEQFFGLPEGALARLQGQRLCQVAGHLMRAETPDYRFDPVLSARARPNPFYLPAKGRIERAAAKRTRPLRPAPEDRPGGPPDGSQLGDRAPGLDPARAQALDQALKRILTKPDGPAQPQIDPRTNFDDEIPF
ncbi:type IV secretory system conjugative DNA transfer family protein [Paenirhodobacter sp. CAU 1674]|uniref:type IV secretory system conjugative DNA transfer family protein n=1 Tax=Paenirhodobacter sp. CAU 1674 TaxID=3032596 RepID=UPI0023DA8D01|nr:type IV secretory system conjugative DNA transfer family protein [Paenirhodobacter sp. CAU 1674]MDF2142925.1 type IV secretory system conjugative DNA transfer family protein [Paenirhodobacter sp. CAU 1674]